MTISKINILQKLSLINEHWSPKIIAELNDSHIKLAKIQGEFIWHHHQDEDELFMVLQGKLVMRLPEGEVEVNPGELIVVPKGVEHMPFAPVETHIMLIELKTTLNTGNIQSERTVEAGWI